MLLIKRTFLYILLISVFHTFQSHAQTTGDFRSKASGNWSDFTIWQVYDGATWVDAISGQVPGGTSEADANNVYLEAGYTVTLTEDHSCKNLFVNSDEDVLRLNLGESTLNVWGKLSLYMGQISDNAYGISGASNPAAPLYLFNNGSNGRIKFLGTVDRTLIAIGEFGANRRIAGLRVEFALNQNVTGIINQNVRIGDFIVSSGIVNVTDLADIRLDMTGIDGQINGTLTVKSGAKLIAGKGLVRISNDIFEKLTVESGGELYFNYTTPTIECQTIKIDGTLGFSRNGIQEFPISTKVGAQNITTINSIVLSGSGIKTLKNNLTINKLSLQGTASLNLNSFTLSYSDTGELEYNGNSAQTTTNSELPATSGPAIITINNSNGVTLHESRTIPGALKLINGLFYLGDNHLTLGANAVIVGSPSVTSMVIPSGTGELRKIFSNYGSFFFPIGDTTETNEYSYAEITITEGSLDATTYFGLRVKDAEHPADVGVAFDNLSRYWALSTNIAGISYNGVFQYMVADVINEEADINSYLYSSESPLSTKIILGGVSTGTHRIFVNDLTSIGFITGSNHCNISNNTISTSSATEFCESATLGSFIGSAPTVSGSATYQWQFNAGSSWQNITSNGTNKDFTEPATLTTGTYKYRRIVYDLISCSAGVENYSNEIIITVLPSITGNSISNDQIVVSGGDPVSITPSSSLSGGTGSYTFSWKSSTSQGGPYSTIPDADAASYDPPSGITETTYYIREVKSGECSSVSNEITITVPICLLLNNTITEPSVIEYCEPTSFEVFDGSEATVTSGIPNYQWQRKFNDGPWENIPGEVNEDFTESSAIVGGLYKYRRILKDNLSCAAGTESFSNEITLNVTPAITDNLIKSDQIVNIGGDPEIFTEVTALGGGNGNYTYQWKSSTTQGGPYTEIASATAATYDHPEGISETTYFIRVVMSENCTSISNEIKVTVDPLSNLNILNNSEISIYPNPSSNKVSIHINHSSNKKLILSIKNSMGIELHTEEINTDDLTTVDITEFPSGIYYINFMLDNGKQSRAYKLYKN